MANLLPNPGADSGTTGWSSGGNTLARVTSPVRTAPGAFSVTAGVAGSVNMLAADISVAAGQEISMSGWSRAATTGRTVTMLVDFWGDAGYLGTGTSGSGSSSSPTSNTTGWVQATRTRVAPAGANRFSMYAQVQGAAAGETHYWDDLFVDYATAALNPPSVNAGADQLNLEPWSASTVTLTASPSGGSGSYSSFTWRQITGPAVTLSGSGASRTFPMPMVRATATYSFGVTVLDSAGATSAEDTLLVSVLPVTEWLAGSPETPLRVRLA